LKLKKQLDGKTLNWFLIMICPCCHPTQSIGWKEKLIKDGLTYREIAEVLDISVKVVENK
jgi:hypothetical protein